MYIYPCIFSSTSKPISTSTSAPSSTEKPTTTVMPEQSEEETNSIIFPSRNNHSNNAIWHDQMELSEVMEAIDSMTHQEGEINCNFFQSHQIL